MQSRAATWNRRSFRRVIVDTHVPDWDPQFLSRFDAARIAAQLAGAGAEAALVYLQAHTGLCYWPTRTGKQHGAFRGRDPAAELIAELGARGLLVGGYYSVHFNNWAWLEHPQWRLQPITRASMGILPKERYGICCPNHSGYRAFVRAQVAEFLAYEIDAVFFDMMWWGGVCGCDACQARCRAETGAAIPQRVDWLDPAWCAYQATRERWLTEWAAELRALVRNTRSEAQVYHNFATGMSNWTRGVSFVSAAAHDFLGGDFYGGADEQRVVTRLMLNLSPSRPPELMTTVTANLTEHVGLKDEQELALAVFAAAASGSTFLAIAALDPDGRLEPAVQARIRSAYRRIEPYEPHLGGDPVEDVAVYFSDDSKMSFAENGVPLADVIAGSAPDYPHFHAVAGACRALQQAHLPYGVVTRRQLDELMRYPVVVLPNVLRMTGEEVDALRAYVRDGGALYASGWTSLTGSGGRRHADFLLADVFGCHFESEEPGRIVYLRVTDPALRAPIPGGRLGHWRRQGERTCALRLRAAHEGRALATLALPLGYPAEGSVGARDWASIHSFPPWQELSRPVLVEHEFGAGRVVYSAADVESAASGASQGLFVTLVRRLLRRAPRFELDTHPAVWAGAFDQRERHRTVVTLLNCQQQPPVLPIQAVPFRLRPPEGRRFTAVRRLPDGASINVSREADGGVHGMVDRLELFAMLAAEWQA